MRYFILTSLILLGIGCGIQDRPEYEPSPDLRGERVAQRIHEIAYNCSNNSRLCVNFLRRLEAGDVTSEGITYFIRANKEAWSKTALALENNERKD